MPIQRSSKYEYALEGANTDAKVAAADSLKRSLDVRDLNDLSIVVLRDLYDQAQAWGYEIVAELLEPVMAEAGIPVA